MNLDERQRAYLGALGIDIWVSRAAVPMAASASAPVTTAEPLVEAHADAVETGVSQMDWPQLRQAVAACTLCDLYKTRTQTVFGVGKQNADWLFIGEAPGADEDRQGEPFVGRAGQLLNNMIIAVGLRREQVFIANILKCRPPNNRDPQVKEARSCGPYLRRQIELLKPRIIVTLGRIAAQNLLQTETPIGKLRGREYEYEDTAIPVVATYHPAYLLRSPGQKRKAWEDLQLAMRLVKNK